MDDEELLATVAGSPSGAGLIMDFDGVLSPIVDDPGTSVLLDGIREHLVRIAGRLATTAVLSGRPLSFLLDRVDIDGITLLGSYGAESVVDGEIRVDERVRAYLPQVRTALDILRDRFSTTDGIRVEEKSTSVAVHWRQAPDHGSAARLVREVTEEVARHTGLTLEPGKLVEELRAPVTVDKGSTVARLLEHGLSPAVYAGDDLGDLPAFLRVTRAGGYAVLVDHGPETPEALRQNATAVIPGVTGMRDWLARLAAELGR